jgi:DNA polymerase-3 subunit delta'
MVEDNKILQYFQTLKRKDAVGTSYLFIGDNFSLVKEVVKLINCSEDEYFCNTCWDCRKIDESNHPDLFIIESENMTIKIDTVRYAQQFLVLKSFRLARKILIIREGEKLSPEAGNAFLKTLEEPPKSCFIAICVSKPEAVLPTIVSRCRQIYLPFTQVSSPDLSMLVEVKRFLKGDKVSFKDRSAFSSFLWSFIIIFRDYLVHQLGSSNNSLLKNREYEIILKSYTVEEVGKILDNAIKVYSVANNININLGLNLIKTYL